MASAARRSPRSASPPKLSAEVALESDAEFYNLFGNAGAASTYAGDLVGRFVMVKDGAGKLGAGPRFGDGWGWAFYEGSETKRTVTTNYQNDCLSCHEPVRASGASAGTAQCSERARK